MTKANQKVLIEDIIGSLRAAALRKADELPEDWDGHEIRRWIGDLYQGGWVMKMTHAREKAYKNEVLVRNLDRR
jgi:hypothetical protein